MGTLEERIKDAEDEIRKTEYNKKSSHHIGKLKAKVAKFKEDLELARSKGGVGKAFAIKKTGHASVALLGPPNVGKSTLLNKMTDAMSRIGDFAFTTRIIVPGMMSYGGANMQLLDMPGILGGASAGRGRGKEVLGVARSADLLVLYTDVFNPDIEGVEVDAREVGIRMNGRPPDITIAKRERGGITVSSTVKLTKIDDTTAKGILNEYGIVNADLVFRMNATPDDLIDHLSTKCVYLPAIVVINKIDLVTAAELKSQIARYKGYKVYPISADKGKGLEELKKGMFEALEFRRVYLKPQGGEVDKSKPLILKKNGTVGDACDAIHRDIKRKFRYALVWGTSVKFPGQRVGLEHKLEDNDVLSMIIRMG
jgi:small GTP-binding protein